MSFVLFGACVLQGYTLAYVRGVCNKCNRSDIRRKEGNVERDEGNVEMSRMQIRKELFFFFKLTLYVPCIILQCVNDQLDAQFL